MWEWVEDARSVLSGAATASENDPGVTSKNTAHHVQGAAMGSERFPVDDHGIPQMAQ